MRPTRRTGIRTAVVHPAGPRTVDTYEQIADWPSPQALYSATARNSDPHYPLTVTGLVAAPGPLRYSELAVLATLGSNHARAAGGELADELAAELAAVAMRLVGGIPVLPDAETYPLWLIDAGGAVGRTADAPSTFGAPSEIR